MLRDSSMVSFKTLSLYFNVENRMVYSVPGTIQQNFSVCAFWMYAKAVPNNNME